MHHLQSVGFIKNIIESFEGLIYLAFKKSKGFAYVHKEVVGGVYLLNVRKYRVVHASLTNPN